MSYTNEESFKKGFKAGATQFQSSSATSLAKGSSLGGKVLNSTKPDQIERNGNNAYMKECLKDIVAQANRVISD